MEPMGMRVADVRSAGPEAVAMDLEPPADFDARPGQFLRLEVDTEAETVAGHYTISSPTVDETVEVTVDVHPDGTVGRRLAAREPGDRIQVAGPFGTASYAGDGAVLAIAGGPGVGAAVAVCERARSAGNAAALVYRDDAPIHEARLATLAASGAPVWSLTDDASVAPAVAQAHRPPQQLFVYGYADDVHLATDAIRAAGGEPAAAKIENYG